MAHEFAHIKNRDTLIMTITATFAGAISMLANFGLLFGGRREGGPGMIASTGHGVSRAIGRRHGRTNGRQPHPRI